MKIVSSYGRDDIAVVYIAENQRKQYIEFVESLDPPIHRYQKWVNIVSTLYGCPVKCPICDAGNEYHGKLSLDEILFQIDFLVKKRFPSGEIDCRKWKIQFARMGEPAFNPAVLDALEILPGKYHCSGIFPCISTIAPKNCGSFFRRLLEIKKRLYPNNFQLQFSLHTTEEEYRKKLIPAYTWSFKEMADYGREFYGNSGRKIGLNFALAKGSPMETEQLKKYFAPDIFVIKVTPINPTFARTENGIESLFEDNDAFREVLWKFQSAGYEVIESIGPLEENLIGSNCGQYISALNRKNELPEGAYSYTASAV